jgi:hypothetical protein
VGGMPDGLTHTDTKVELVECTPARTETRVGDGCSKWRKSRGRIQGSSVLVEPANCAGFAGKEQNSVWLVIGKERVTVNGGY